MNIKRKSNEWTVLYKAILQTAWSLWVLRAKHAERINVQKNVLKYIGFIY